MGEKPTLLSKLVQESIGQQRLLGNTDDDAQLTYPRLWEWLTSTNAGASHVKEPGRLQIGAIPGGWLVSLSDASLGVTVDTKCETLETALVALEKALAEDSVTVRVWSKSNGNLRKKQEPKT